MSQVLPKKAHWIKDRANQFFPEENRLVTASGEEINYEYLVVAMGLQLDYDKAWSRILFIWEDSIGTKLITLFEQIKGLPEAFNTPGVCSNYSTLYVGKTLECLQKFKEGNAIFTFPNTPIKCAGAPQKAMYISEEYLKKVWCAKPYPATMIEIILATRYNYSITNVIKPMSCSTLHLA